MVLRHQTHQQTLKGYIGDALEYHGLSRDDEENIAKMVDKIIETTKDASSTIAEKASISIIKNAAKQAAQAIKEESLKL